MNAYFREVLVESLERQGIRAAEETEHYLVELLGGYACSQISNEPLSLKLVQADEPGDRVRALKEVGDTSLYVTGFFAESIHRQLVKADYYMSLGSAAYRELAARLGGSSVREVYEELAAKFPKFVDVLSDIRSQVNFAGTDVVALYEEWVRSRSEWVEERLRGLGVVVSNPGDKLVQ